MTGKRAAIYARYSTDHQNDRSIEDQVELCRTHAAKSGFSVTVQYSDRARTSASLFGRDGILDLIDDAKAGRFDVVIVESLDRVSRDQADLAGVFKRLSHYGVQIIAVHDGVADAVQVGLRGLMGSIFLSDLKNKTRRGMAGVVREGRSAGGRAFGYRPVPGRPGELVIVEEEAEVIRRIFTEYADGKSPRDIASGLNRDRVAPPRGAQWNASTINGNATRGYGILLNSMYRGEMIWNRVRMVRDPDTGQRVSRVNPEAEWQRQDVPTLRIVPDELAEAVLARKTGFARKASPRVRSKRLLSGLLRCGHCGSAMVIAGSKRTHTLIECSGAKESGICSVKRRVRLEPIERTVVTQLKAQLASPETMAAYVEAFNEERRHSQDSATRERTKSERRLGEVRREMDRIVEAIGRGDVDSADVRDRMTELRTERGRLERSLERAAAEAEVVALHPAALQAYQKDLYLLASQIGDALSERAEARQAFHALVSDVVVTVNAPHEPATIEVRGRLSALLGHSVAPDTGVVGVVAGEGLEPPTRGL